MMNEEQDNKPTFTAQFFVGIFLFSASILLWIDANGLPSGNAIGVGPSAGLRLVSALLLILACVHFVGAWRSRRTATLSVSRAPIDMRSLGWGVGGMIAMISIIAMQGGFIIAATVLFIATAKAFGKPIGWRSAGIGLVLSIIASLFFTQLLMLSLPAGIVENLLYLDL